ncbi:MAG: hypothetical protein CVU63_06565 [Deltaproteobacteria bacterium HGW-Deltaproteobacteria-20]|nr:MAG: hypothetical protein CVU63_06565 [Deltaproteobacteria bacterium HGW-Deltaproteobacteria-20]
MPPPVPRHLLRPGLVAVVAVALVALFLTSVGKPKGEPNRAPGPEGEEPAAAADVIALLDNLQPGDSLGPGVVLAIDAPVERIVWVDVRVGDRVFGVGVGASGTGGDKPMPITTDRYEIRYGMLRGDGELAPGAFVAAAEDLASRVRRREPTVPVPVGM